MLSPNHRCSQKGRCPGCRWAHNHRWGPPPQAADGPFPPRGPPPQVLQGKGRGKPGNPPIGARIHIAEEETDHSHLCQDTQPLGIFRPRARYHQQLAHRHWPAGQEPGFINQNQGTPAWLDKATQRNRFLRSRQQEPQRIPTQAKSEGKGPQGKAPQETPRPKVGPPLKKKRKKKETPTQDWSWTKVPPLPAEEIPGLPEGFPSRPPNLPAMMPRGSGQAPSLQREAGEGREEAPVTPPRNQEKIDPPKRGGKRTKESTLAGARAGSRRKLPLRSL